MKQALETKWTVILTLIKSQWFTNHTNLFRNDTFLCKFLIVYQLNNKVIYFL